MVSDEKQADRLPSDCVDCLACAHCCHHTIFSLLQTTDPNFDFGAQTHSEHHRKKKKRSNFGAHNLNNPSNLTQHGKFQAALFPYFAVFLCVQCIASVKKNPSPRVSHTNCPSRKKNGRWTNATKKKKKKKKATEKKSLSLLVLECMFWDLWRGVCLQSNASFCERMPNSVFRVGLVFLLLSCPQYCRVRRFCCLRTEMATVSEIHAGSLRQYSAECRKLS